MALDGTFTLYDLDALTELDTSYTLTVGGVLRLLGATNQQPAIGEQISLYNADAAQSEFYSVIATAGTELLLSDGTNLFLLAPSGITQGSIVETDSSVAACFAEGARILTAEGEIPVEALRVGDLVVALVGRRLARVEWVGRSSVELLARKLPRSQYPVRIQAGALADAQPQQDLLLSPDHALLVDGTLVPVRLLVNGASIAHATELRRVTYHHIELDRHDAVLANGTPAETFLDTGNRHQFDSANIHALFAPAPVDSDAALRIWAERGCARLLLSGPALAILHRRFRERAALLGYVLTEDADLRFTAGGRRLPATQPAPGVWQVQLAAGIDRLELLSRSGPALEIASGLDDRRCLGVALAGLALDGYSLALDDTALAEGFHPVEPNCRWTDGAAMLRLPTSRDVRTLTVQTHPGWRLYWDDAAQEQAARRA
jgi:hypothetical protein